MRGMVVARAVREAGGVTLHPIALHVFDELPSEGREQLIASAQHRFYHPGSRLMEQADASDSIYVIVAGRVRVERSDPRIERPLVLAELGPGEIVGEMGVLDGSPRSASVVALDATETMEFDAGVIAATIQSHPGVAAALLRICSRRLRATNDLVTEVATHPEK
jgi:CRP/FNR family cyclic AMP-dependent transcriptional regulator